MRAGILEETIKILKLNKRKSDFGAQLDTYTESENTIRAGVVENSGNRITDNFEIFYDYTKKFYVRRYVQLDEFDRILYKGKQWRILSINDDRHLNQKIITAELVNE